MPTALRSRWSWFTRYTLSALAWKARANRLDSEHLFSVRACAAYWHFLEAVWIALLAAFFVWG